MPNIAGISWQRLEHEGAVIYPCPHEEDMDEVIVFTEHFPTSDGIVKFVPADLIPAAEKPDNEYPIVLITGRQLEHWHTDSMTRRASALDALELDPVAMIHPDDLQTLGVQAGGLIAIQSHRGEVCLYAHADRASPRGAVFVAFCFYEAAIDRITNAALDPFGKIPEFKYCAVKLRAGGVAPI